MLILWLENLQKVKALYTDVVFYMKIYFLSQYRSNSLFLYLNMFFFVVLYQQRKKSRAVKNISPLKMEGIGNLKDNKPSVSVLE